MSPERGIGRKEDQDNLDKREYVFWKHLSLITMQEAERLGISSEAPVFVSPYMTEKHRCDGCGVHYSPIIYHKKGLIKPQHYHGPLYGGIYHFMTAKKHFDEGVSYITHVPRWIAILDPVSLSIDPLLESLSRPRYYSGISTSSEAVNLLQFRAFPATSQELKEGFLVTDERGVNLFPSSTKDHPFITDLGFRIIEDGSVQFFNHSSLTPRSF